jgi:hypothetical protein
MQNSDLIDPVELFRSSHAQEVELTVEVLKAAGIPHALDLPETEDEVAMLGQIQGGDKSYGVMVSRTDETAARAALEASFADSELPAGHFLNDATEADLVEVLANPAQWSAFDVAKARKLAQERGLDLTQEVAKEAEVQAAKRQRVAGSPIGLLLAGVGIVITAVMLVQGQRGFTPMIGTLVGILIAQHYGWTQQEGSSLPYYDERTQQAGRWLVMIGVVVLVLPKVVAALQ